MCKSKLFLFTGMLVTLLLAACQPLIVPVTPTAKRTEQSTAATATTSLTNTITLSGTTAVSAAVVRSAETVAARTEPTLTVIVASLRIRSGPDTAYDVLGAAPQGEQYPIVGQADGCQWYQVTHPQLGVVWLSGRAQYVSINVACDQVAEVVAPALPTPVPTPVAPTASPVPVQAEQANNPEPTPTAPSAQPGNDPFPADQGCLLLQNQLGPELTFTFTNADSSWRDSIKVNSDQDVPYCLTPGHYRVTIDAPPPWSSLNRDFDIKAGDRAYFPIRPQ